MTLTITSTVVITAAVTAAIAAMVALYLKTLRQDADIEALGAYLERVSDDVQDEFDRMYTNAQTQKDWQKLVDRETNSKIKKLKRRIAELEGKAPKSKAPQFTGVATATVTKSGEKPSFDVNTIRTNASKMVAAPSIGKSKPKKAPEVDLTGTFSTTEAAEYLGKWIYDVAQDGRIGTKVKGRFVYTKEELDWWAANKPAAGRPRKGVEKVSVPMELRFQGGE